MTNWQWYTSPVRIVPWLRERIDEQEQRDPSTAAIHRLLLAEILRYEATIDGEWGCCHSAEAIASGECTAPEEVNAIALLAALYADEPGYNERWRPEVGA